MTVHLMSAAGATRIRVMESQWSTADPIEECILGAHCRPNDILNVAPRVEFEDANYLKTLALALAIYADIEVAGRKISDVKFDFSAQRTRADN
jgi:hypothetical protein